MFLVPTSRRSFLRLVGVSLSSAAALASCSSDETASGETACAHEAPSLATEAATAPATPPADGRAACEKLLRWGDRARDQREVRSG